MAQCSESAHELLSRAFNPQIAAIVSPDAQALCERNNLKFTQLISPFSTLSTTLYWQEPGGIQISPRCFKLTPVDIASWKPPRLDTQRNKKFLQSRVAQILPQFSSESYALEGDGSDHTISSTFQSYKLGKPGLTEEYSVEVPSTTPWYESWRELVLKLQSEQQSGQHEFMNHFIGCIMVISSSEGKSADELAHIIGKLSKLQQQHQLEWPNSWFLPAILKFYLILHDNSMDDSKSAEGLYQSLRTMYTGNACYMLKLNTGGSGDVNRNWKPFVPDPWASLFDLQEQDSFSTHGESGTNDMLIDSISISSLPHPLSPEEDFPSSVFPPSFENGILGTKSGRTSNERFTASIPRGQFMTPEDLQNIQIAVNEFIGKALLPYVERQTRVLYESIVNRRSMSKSFFGATKRLFGTTSKPVTNVVYGMDSLEITSRKLADLYFLFGNYSGAYQLYHQLKKDFQADQAWVYYSSALEMAALSHFMMTQLESPLSGARSFPVHYVNEAIRIYLENCRMPDSAIRCAILCCECLKQLENYGEAAAVLIRMTSEECDLRSALMLEQAAYAFIKLNSPRKFALHSVLAGHRYAKAGLRSHSLNSYFQAAQIYYGRGWRFAEDHVLFTIAKHQSLLQMHRGLAQHLKSLLRTPTPQSPPQTYLYYKEFLSMMSKLFEVEGKIQDFFIPSICCSGIRLRIGNSDLPVGEVDEIPVADDATASFWDSLEEQVVKECVEQSLVRFKPSKLVFEESTNNTVHPSVPCNESIYIEIPLHNPLSVELTLQNIRLKFEPGTTVSCTCVFELSLEANQTKIVRFEVASSRRGRITYEWLYYDLKLGSTVCPFQQKFVLKGPRLNSTKVEKSGKIYAKDFRNEINVIEQMPLLQVQVENLPQTLFHSQLTPFNFLLKDKSKDPSERKRITRVILASEGMHEFLEVSKSDGYVIQESKRNYSAMKLNFDDSTIVARIPCVFRAPQTGESVKLKILIVYQVSKRIEDLQHSCVLSNTPPSSSKLEWEPLHRVVKVSINVPLLPCLRLEYSFIKPLNAVSYLGLLKIHNLTEAEKLELDGIEFKPSKLKVEQLISNDVSSNGDKDTQTFFVGPAESRSLVLRAKEIFNGNDEETSNLEKQNTHLNSLFLHLTWQFTPEQSSSLSRTTGNYKLRIRKADLITKSMGSTTLEIPLLFQLVHNPRVEHDFQAISCCVCPVELIISSKWNGRVSIEVTNYQNNKSEGVEKPPTGKMPSSEEVFFVGQTKWIIDIEELKSCKLVYYAAVSHPGIYNVAPSLIVKKYVQSDSAESDFVVGSQQVYALHSPLIVAHAVPIGDYNENHSYLERTKGSIVPLMME